MNMTMTFSEALIYSLLGMLVVFFALFLLMCIIKLMTAIGGRRENAAAPAGVPAPAAEPQPLAPGAAGEFKLYGTDPRTAAMLMAIVADELQAPLNELRFISIREIDNGNDSERES
ncbi:MAG: OadG family protein [Firmicutes bacterium]|nr:OadG family protein [Oscillospiraceae bacterium]MBS5432301.1 OadG family protein [Bacillota bacterium]